VIYPLGAIFAPGGQLYPGAIFTVGSNIHPWEPSSPLGAIFTPGSQLHSWWSNFDPRGEIKNRSLFPHFQGCLPRVREGRGLPEADPHQPVHRMRRRMPDGRRLLGRAGTTLVLGSFSALTKRGRKMRHSCNVFLVMLINKDAEGEMRTP
jgi:hypothetical protein